MSSDEDSNEDYSCGKPATRRGFRAIDLVGVVGGMLGAVAAIVAATWFSLDLRSDATENGDLVNALQEQGITIEQKVWEIEQRLDNIQLALDDVSEIDERLLTVESRLAGLGSSTSQSSIPPDQETDSQSGLSENANSSTIDAPARAVLAFNSDQCPAGWEPFAQASGRVIVGSGVGEGLTPRIFREEGGAERVALTIAELPPHNHGPSISPRGGQDLSSDSRGREGAVEREPRDVGRGEPHENMPPYIVLTICEKV